MSAPADAGADLLRRRPPPPMPVSVITGFLGAGKTTLLNRLLRDPALSDTVVLINEFGEIGLDHLLVERVEGDMMVLSSGCICCSIRGELVTALEDLLKRRDNNRMPPFSRVIIETTGLADPASVLHTLMTHPYLVLRFRLDGVITLVDAINGAATLDAHVESVKQAAVADRLVITKEDLLEPDSAVAGALRERLLALNPSARVIPVADADAASLLDAGLYDPRSKTPDVRRWLNAEAFAATAARSGVQMSTAKDLGRHGPRIESFVLKSPKYLAPGTFDMFCELLREAHGPKLLRIKGIVGLSDDPNRPVVIHGVQHVFHPPVRLAAWPDDDRTTRIVFILADLAPDFVQRMWSAFAGDGGTDVPDADAVLDNPLAPRAGRDLLG